MFDFIPLDQYTAIYYHAMFVVMLIIMFHASLYELNDYHTVLFSKYFGLFFVFLVLFYMGTRPISWVFEDMTAYALKYRLLMRGYHLEFDKDILFSEFMLICSKVLTAQQFFFFVDFIYIVPTFLFARKYFGKYWFFGFFMFAASLSFWSYGTNGIRNGMATSIFILALVFYKNIFVRYILMGLAFGFHNSLIIPITAFLISGVYKNPKIYLYIWVVSVPLSLIGGSFWENFVGDLFDDKRAQDYLTQTNVNKDIFAYTGFRWDFVFYSFFAVFAGWYFIFKKNITDKFYIHLWGTYMIANAFWILVIRANFSNRFAYLSWFLMGAVIGYPLFRYKLWNDQYRIGSIIIAVYYLFTYFMFLRG